MTTGDFFGDFNLPYWFDKERFADRFGEKPKKRFNGYSIGYYTQNGKIKSYDFYVLDPSFPIKILLEGTSGAGKSVLSRVLEEVFLLDYVDKKIPHPIFHIDYKNNYLGFGETTRNRDHLKTLLKMYEKSEVKKQCLRLMADFPKNYFVPAYAVPAEEWEQEDKLREMQQKYAITDIWRIGWRTVLDLKWLAGMFNVHPDRKWTTILQDVFEKCVANDGLRFSDVVGEGGFLETQINKIHHQQSRNSAIEFLEQWRRRAYLFDETDTFAEHLEDDFSYNVLTFNPSYDFQTQNQISFVIALQGIIHKLQRLQKRTQPIFVISDALFTIGKGAIDPKASTRAIMEIFNGFGRSGSVGFCIILETQNAEEMADEIRPKGDRYTHHFKMNPIVRDQNNRVVDFQKGKGIVTDNLSGLYKTPIRVRPPFTHYTG